MGPAAPAAGLASPAIESRMLRFSRMRARRCFASPARPNIRSKATRGLISIGSGAVVPAHEIVFM